MRRRTFVTPKFLISKNIDGENAKFYKISLPT